MFFKLGEYTLATFLGVLVSFIVGHFLSKDRDRQTHKAIAFHEAAKEFRHSFDNILLNIEQGDHPVHELLRNFFLQHKVAIWHFKYYFTGKNRKRLEKTWNDYHDFYNEYYEEGSILAPFASTKTLCETQKLNELIGHIENLLKFTT